MGDRRPYGAGRLRSALTLMLALALGGCASTPPWPDTPTNTDRTLLTHVPFYPQEQYQCGPAALAMMLGSQGVSETPDALVDKVYLPERHGSLQVEMVAAARQYGLLVYPLAPTLDAVIQEVNHGNPVLVMQNLRFGWWPQWHFAVVIGYDEAAQELILHSGTERNYHQPLAAFMATWDRTDNWARVMLPPSQLPATAEPLPFLRAANDLETTHQTDAARTAYATALATWPDQPAAQLGLGNIAFAEGDWPQAAGRYASLTRDFPRLSAGWNNYGEALEQLDCPQAAQQARHCAATLNPERFEAAAAEVGDDETGRDCPVIDCPAP